MAQAVLDAMMAGETVVDPRCFGWRLELIRGVDASSVLDVDGFSLHLERLEPERFQSDLFGAVHVLESQRGQMGVQLSANMFWPMQLMSTPFQPC